jgi:hypothetical protein
MLDSYIATLKYTVVQCVCVCVCYSMILHCTCGVFVIICAICTKGNCLSYFLEDYVHRPNNTVQ